MKKKINLLQLIIFTGFLVVFSCEKDFLADNTCDVSNPLEELPWLKNIITDLEQSSSYADFTLISMARYQGETVFLESNCNPAANSITPVINCSGDRIGILGEISPGSLTDMKVIWKSQNSHCITK